jgi:hypothetical protein
VAAELGQPVTPQRPAAPRLLSATELEAMRDDLAEKVGALRAHLATVREAGRSNRGIASSAPQTVVGASGWTLRWRL